MQDFCVKHGVDNAQIERTHAHADERQVPVSSKKRVVKVAVEAVREVYLDYRFRQKNRLPVISKRFADVAALCRTIMKEQLDKGVGKKSFRDYIIVIDKYLLPFFVDIFVASIDRDIVLQGLTAIETGQIKHIRYGAGSPYIDLKLLFGGALELVIDPAPNLEMLRAALGGLYARKMAGLSFATQSGFVRFQYAPKPALIPAGRGAILRTTASLAAHMDFELHIASPDSDDIDSLGYLAPKSCQPMTTP